MFWRLSRFLFKLGLFACLAIGLGIAVLWFQTPDVRKLEAVGTSARVEILDRHGAPLIQVGNLFESQIPVGELPQDLVDAVTSIEDRRFFEHFGIDVRGIARAVVTNLQRGRFAQGGSTITQQLAKNLFLGPERTLWRKVQEAVLALKLEVHFSKDEILSLYLNRVYFGAGTYGVNAASQRFFQKSARDLDLFESAALAGLLKAPSRYNPARSFERTHGRSLVVIQAMAAAGKITPDLAAIAQDNLDIRFYDRANVSTGSVTSANGYFTDWILSRLQTIIGTPDQDIIVKTTLDPQMQARAADALATVVQNARGSNADQAAFIAMDGAGSIHALVGGTSYAKSQFNRATRSLRQTGSTFKLYVYLAALSQGLTLGTLLYDGPMDIDGWKPQNYNGRFNGDVPLETAFRRSLNAASVWLSEQIGRDAVLAMAQLLGVTSKLVETPSVALGTSEASLIETTTAFTVVANGGQRVQPFGILSITDKNGNELYHASPDQRRILAPQIAEQGRQLLRAAVRDGSGRRANYAGVHGGKTGTTQNFRDAWFIGYNDDVVAGVWVGNDKGEAMDGITGGSLPVEIWLRALNVDRTRPAQQRPVQTRQAPQQRPQQLQRSIFADGVY